MEGNKHGIYEMLNQLPDNFKKESGGGMTFLNACVDVNGIQWGEHRSVEQLVVLGLAINKVRYCFPREFWDSMPGGMPYIVVE